MSIKFKVGDKVKIIKKITERSDDFQNSWVSRMDGKIGKSGVIYRIAPQGVCITGISYSYPPASLVKIGFSSFDEVISYMRRGGYVLTTLLDTDTVCYRIRNGDLEINSPDLRNEWGLSAYDIQDIKRGSVTNLELFTKRKYS